MNVSNKFLVLLALLLNLNLVFSFNVCNVDIDEPWFIVNDNLGNDIFIVDNDGDIYFEGQDHSLNNVNSEDSFEVGSSYFNRISSSFNSFSQNLGVLPASINSLIIKSDLGTNVSLFDETGNIYTLGQGVYDNSQAGCLADGGYCVGNILEDRDYYCDITGSKTGNCDMTVLSSIDCSTRLSTDTDGGDNIYTQGTVTDFITCSFTDPSSYCTFVPYTDYCQDSSNLVEFSNSGSFYNIRTVNQNEPNYYFCDGSTKYMYRDYNCLTGKFQFNQDLVIDTCIVPSPDYTSWSCISDTRRRRTVTTYSPTCSAAGGCSQSSSNSFETQTAPTGYLCGGGNWVHEPKVINIISSQWTVNLPGTTNVPIQMISEYATSCSWCGHVVPCNGNFMGVNSGNSQYEDCAAVASNIYGHSDIKYGNTDCHCIATQKSSCTFNGLTGSTGTGPSLDQCYDYTWFRTGTYGSCSVSCGGGIQYENIDCQRSDGAIVSDSKCSGTKPTYTKSCNTQSCCTSHDHKGCVGDDSYWYNSCNVREDMYSGCDQYSSTKCTGAGVCTCSSFTSCGGGTNKINGCGETIECGSTPYLFSGINNDYYIENDVLSTYFNQYYENAKEWYEKDSGDKQIYTLTDYYEMRLNPTVEEEGVKLLLKEIEPEESHIDEIKLLRTIYDKNANLIINHEENSIKIVEEKLLENNLLSCHFREDNCVDDIMKIDNKFISAEARDEIKIELDISELKGKEVYLIINSWGHITMKNQLEPLEAYSEASIRTTFDLGNGEYEVLKDIHPRTIESNHYLYISDIIDNAQNDKINMKLLFTAEHNLDSIQMMIVEEKSYIQEELSLIKATHDKNGNVLFNLLNNDHMYAHTVRGDEIELLFSKPQLELKEGEKETYVFVSSGFYHGLRTYLYPEVNPNNDFLPEIENYVKELKNIK